MSSALAWLEIVIFVAFAVRALYDSEEMIECIIFTYLCQIINYKLVGGLPWLAVGGINLFPGDFVAVLMIVILVVRSVRLELKFFTIAITVFLLMLTQAAFRGILVFGISGEFLSDFRKYLYFLTAIIYFWKMPVKKMNDAFWKRLNIIFWAITVYMWIILIFYFAGHPLGERVNQRPLLSDYAIVYTAYLAIRWYQDLVLSQKGKIGWTTLIFTITLIFNRFNTTWAALGVAIIVLIIGRLWDEKHRKVSYAFYVQIAFVILGTILFMRQGGEMTEALVETSEKFDINQNNTFSSRIELWKALMLFVKGHYAVVGYPFGSGFHASYRGTKWLVSPHNGYLETLMRSGYIGVTAMIAALISIIVRAARRKMILPIMLCAVCMTYWVGYSLTLEQGMLVGLCARAVFELPKEKTDPAG